MQNQIELNTEGFDDLLEGAQGEPIKEETTETTTETQSVESPYQEPEEETSQEPEESQETEVTEDDYLTTFLSDYGVKNGKVTYENEDGSTEEVDFKSLDPQEKLNILKELTNPNLTKDEIDTINYLRQNHASIQDVINYYSQKAVEKYIADNGPAEKEYAIDEYSDDEVYVADLKAKYSDMTDDEIKADLENAKSNEELFKKKVETLRKQYKDREDEEYQDQLKEQENRYNDYKNSVTNLISQFNEISMDYKDRNADSLLIEDSEKEQIYRYILDLDENGYSQFFKDLNDPKMQVELAWFALFGKEALSDISNYWKSQLKNTRRAESKSQTTVVQKKDEQKQKISYPHHNVVDIDFDERLL